MQYITDPRFQVLSVGIGLGGKINIYPGDTPLWKARIAELNDDGHIFIAHNARFDFRILSLRHGITPRWMSDTMLMARFRGYPQCGLGALSERLLPAQKLELDTNGKRLNVITLSEWRKLARYNAKDIELTRKLFHGFAHKLPPMELALIDQTLKLCLKPHSIDWPLVESHIANLEESLATAKKKNVDLFENRNRSAWVRNYIRDITGVDPKTVDKKKIVMDELSSEAKEI